jgi:hypothetical protein
MFTFTEPFSATPGEAKVAPYVSVKPAVEWRLRQTQKTGNEEG